MYGSQTWGLKENWMAILRRSEKAVKKAKHGVRLVHKRNSQESLGILSLEETVDRLAKASGVRWHEHALMRDAGVLRRALTFEVVGRKKRPKMTWRR